MHRIRENHALETMGPGRIEPINKATKVLWNSQLYSEPQTVYTLRVRGGHMSKVLMNSRYMQSQGQVAHGRNMVFP